jgi:tetratricopeptide (TPR) repeat protein
MALFDLFKKKPSPTQPAATPPPSKPEMIRVFDKYGRPMEVTREEWRTKVLPGHLKQHWDNPDILYSAIVQGLQDGFTLDVLPAANHLAKTDHNKLRGSVIKIVTLLQLQRYSEALAAGESALKELGPDGVLLTNIAKAQAGLGLEELSEKTLWQALQMDPNQDNALLWYAVTERERGGETAEQAAFERVAAIEGSWRAQLWLARSALKARQLSKALSLYKEVFQNLHPLPTDAFMQITGDLGQNGFVQEIIELCSPHFEIDLHGLPGGNNLLKAYVEMKQPQQARELLKKMFSLQRPDWRENLQYWENEIDKLDRFEGPIGEERKLEMALIPYVDRPIWAPLDSLLSPLIPARQTDSPAICFMCGSIAVDASKEGNNATVGKTEARGRFTRGLAIWLTEQTLMQTSQHATLLVPWMKDGGFVLSGARWDIETLSHLDPAPDWIVFSHLDANGTPWNLEISLQNFTTKEVAYQANHPVNPIGDGNELIQIWQSLSKAMRQIGIADIAQPPEWCVPPRIDMLPHYLAASEQALAVSCAGAEATNPFLYAERSINDAMLDLAVRNSQSPLPLLLLLGTLLRQKERVPEIVSEYLLRTRSLVDDANVSADIKKLANEVLNQLSD